MFMALSAFGHNEGFDPSVSTKYCEWPHGLKWPLARPLCPRQGNMMR
jgi:hypothetical protein